MIRLDAATVLLQWSVGGLLFLWVTVRRRVVGVGYGWLLRSIYLSLLVASVAVAQAFRPLPARDVAAVLAAAALGWSLLVSVRARRAGVAGQDAHNPSLDLVAPAIGMAGLVAASFDTGGPVALALLRTVVGAAFLGAVTDAMLLGHWYLVQPGLSRAPLLELNRLVAMVWPVEVIALLIPTGMVSVFTGAIDDGWGGTLGFFWIACAVTTIVLCGVTAVALKEQSYAAVMAATGLLYLAILTAFGTDLIARALLAS